MLYVVEYLFDVEENRLNVEKYHLVVAVINQCGYYSTLVGQTSSGLFSYIPLSLGLKALQISFTVATFSGAKILHNCVIPTRQPVCCFY